MVTSSVSQLGPFGRVIQKSREIPLLASIALGVGFLGALSQVVIPLPFTPVPVTGQTFGVALLALLWGRKRGWSSVGAYLVLGSAGLPLFSRASSLWVAAPTTGYLIGMFAAAGIMGMLSDRGFVRGFKRAFAAAALGSAITFVFGVAVLAQFVPDGQALALGWIPFIPGDLIKITLVAWIVSRSSAQRA